MSHTREVTFRPAFDKRDPDPNKNYGIHGAEMTFLLRGDEGAVQFVVYTQWHLPHVQEELDAKAHTARFPHWHPLPADIGYHSPKPMYEGHPLLTESCSVLGGKPCYYDGSSLNAQRYFDLLIAEGSDAVWSAMEDYYAATFAKETA